MPQPDRDLIAGCDVEVSFPITDWFDVLSIADGNYAALEAFCRDYWRPIYAYIRRRNHSPCDAEDLTQEFFARFLENSQITKVNPERGRLRSFLLVSVQSFLAHDWAYYRAKKRGGATPTIPIAELNWSESDFLKILVDPATPPNQAFEYHWAVAVLTKSAVLLRADYKGRLNDDDFGMLKRYSIHDSREFTPKEIAAKLGMSKNALGVAVHRLRQQYNMCLQEAVRLTLTNPDEKEDEMRHLFTVINSYLGSIPENTNPTKLGTPPSR